MTLSRRRFVQGAGVVGLGLLAGCGRLPGQVQPAPLPRLGILSPRAAPSADLDGALLEALRERGWIEEQTLAIERQFVRDSTDRPTDLVARLVAARVDIIVTGGAELVWAAKGAAATLPVVMTGSGDPVGEGLVVSLARPGGNVTGLSVMSAALAGKRLELLAAILPALSRVAYLGDPDGSPSLERRELEVAAGALGTRLQVLEVPRPYDFEAAFDLAIRERADGIVVASPGSWSNYWPRITDLALRSRLPSISNFRHFAQEGGLMSYGVPVAAQWRSAATYVDKILNGAKPADLPVEQPTRFDFVINLKTAQALGLTIPPHVLLQSTEVIQ
jgi:putative tryptophan/tyrosine transport system substrate-binding protein